MLAAKTQASKSKSEASAVKAKDTAQPPAQAPFNPVWGQLAMSIQPKLAVSAPDDPYEREADRVADRVMRMAEPRIQRQCTSCEEGQEKLSRKESGTAANAPVTVPPVVQHAINAPGQPLDTATRGFFESRFEHDFSQVRIHADTQASTVAKAVQARAYASGQNIVFGAGEYAPSTVEGKRLLAHELAHVIQQGNIAPAQNMQKASGGSAQETRFAMPHLGLAVQRFGGTEHRDIGDTGAPGVKIDLGGGLVYSYGEVVAMAGDWFESIDEMRALVAKGADGIAEIQWAHWKSLGGAGTEPTVSDTIKTNVMNRYFTLAGKNVSHFGVGGTAMSSYEGYHTRALHQAFVAGQQSSADSWSDALAIEAFGNHYLSDQFSAGHVRTERAAIQSWYVTKFPNSIDSIVAHMAHHMHDFLVSAHSTANFFGMIPSEAELVKDIQQKGGPALKSFTLGDIVSLAYHNEDNDQGLNVVAEVNESGKAVPGGFKWQAFGDNNLSKSPTTKNMAVAAIKASLADLDAMKSSGVAAQGPLSPQKLQIEEAATLAKLQPFAAKRFVPHLDTSAKNTTMVWQWGLFNKEMFDAVDKAVKGEIANTLADKAKEEKDANKRQALEDLATYLRTAGIGALETAMSAKAMAPAPAPTP